MIFSPRQARDKHRQNSEKSGVFSQDDYPQPTAESCPLAAALRHYARGLAFAATVRAVDFVTSAIASYLLRNNGLRLELVLLCSFVPYYI
jgi:hypothetical protein